MPQIRIVSDEVRAAAQKFRKEKTEMDTILKNVQGAVRALDADWQSDSSRAMIQNFNNLSATIAKYANNIEEYAKFTDSTAEAYDTLEIKQKSRSDQFIV